jgi:integrase
VSQRYAADLKSKLGRFSLAFGERLVCNITSQELDEWLRGLNVNVTSRDAYRRNLGVMFELARRRGYCAQNVAAEVRFSKRHKDEVSILSPGQITRLLQVCASELVPYIAICAFAGLRPSEAERLDWRDIHLEAGQIEVKARNAKTRRHRLVPIQPNLKEWLSLYRRETGRVIFSRRRFREAYRKAGFMKWPQDVMRHSFGTYRLPILKSAEELALEMGNSPDVIFGHYRRVTDAVTAAAYFKIRPADRFRPSFIIVSDTQDEAFSQKVVDGDGRNTPATLDTDCRKAA